MKRFTNVGTYYLHLKEREWNCTIHFGCIVILQYKLTLYPPPLISIAVKMDPVQLLYNRWSGIFLKVVKGHTLKAFLLKVANTNEEQTLVSECIVFGIKIMSASLTDSSQSSNDRKSLPLRCTAGYTVFTQGWRPLENWVDLSTIHNDLPVIPSKINPVHNNLHTECLKYHHNLLMISLQSLNEEPHVSTPKEEKTPWEEIGPIVDGPRTI